MNKRQVKRVACLQAAVWLRTGLDQGRFQEGIEDALNELIDELARRAGDEEWQKYRDALNAELDRYRTK